MTRRLLPAIAALTVGGLLLTSAAGGPSAATAGEAHSATSAASKTGAASPPRGNSEYKVLRVHSPGPAADQRWGERLAAAHTDLDGDGVSDYFVGQPASGASGTGSVWLVSGRTGAVVYQIRPPESQQDAKFGFGVSVLGDVTGDGLPDIAAGTDAQDIGNNDDQGAAWVFSGADGRMLYRLDNPSPQPAGRFGSRMGRAGDVTADGIPDVVVGASGNDAPAGCGEISPEPPGCHPDQGQAFIFDGSNGQLVRALDLPAEDQAPPSCDDCGAFGLAVQGPGDTDSDGVTDQLVSAGSVGGIGRMYLFSGATGELLLRVDDPEPQQGATFGFQDAAPLSPGDVNGDGYADLYGNGFLQDGQVGRAQGRAWIFNGRTGDVLYELRDPTPTVGGQFAFSETSTDHNGDETPDIYVGQSPHHVPDSVQNGGTYILDGEDGSLLQSLELPASDRQRPNQDSGPRLGWTNAAPGDLNGDGQPDYIAGAPFADVGGNADQGVVYVFLSRGNR